MSYIREVITGKTSLAERILIVKEVLTVFETFQNLIVVDKFEQF